MDDLEFDLLARSQFEDLFKQLKFQYRPEEEEEMISIYIKLLRQSDDLTDFQKLMFIAILKEIIIYIYPLVLAYLKKS